MKKKLHPSWVLGWSSLGILIGIGLSLLSADYFLNLSWLSLGISLVIISIINRRASLIILALAGGLMIGLWRGTQNYPTENTFQRFINQQTSISGVVSEDVAFGKDGQQQIKIKEVNINGKPVSGQVWLSTSSKIEVKRSDRVEVDGKLSKGFGSFEASMYRADLVSVTRIKHGDIARELRDWFSTSIRKTINEPQASLGIGFLTGQHSSLPESLSNNLRILGLTHIIVASGYNLTILVRFARRALAGISKYLATLVSVLLIIGFIFITGSSPSMTRAGLITGLSLMAWYFGRRIHPLVLIPFSASITVLINPAYLWGDLGWYLSFAAFSGVIILSPLLVNYFWGKDKPGSIKQVLVETTSAQIITIPIIAYAFGQYAPLAPISNLLVLPAIPLTMLLTFIAGIGGLLLGGMAGWVGLPAQTILGYVTFVAEKLSSLPIARGEITFSFASMVISYVFIIIFAVWLWRRTRHDFSEDSIVE